MRKLIRAATVFVLAFLAANATGCIYGRAIIERDATTGKVIRADITYVNSKSTNAGRISIPTESGPIEIEGLESKNEPLIEAIKRIPIPPIIP